jgi:BirA family transcriptional regulator, biotin operon repressor / biotin---[acetyl-CoA-carboxylase] ligase
LPHPPFQPGIGTPFIELQSVDSTNNYALDRVHAGLAQHGTVFFTHEQVAGKGQRGKSWTAGKDSSLILSIVLDPGPLVPAQQFQLSACVAVSVCRFFQSYAGDATRIKWPNDLYWHDRKAGGILIENIIGREKTAGQMTELPGRPATSQPPSSGWQWAITGIGINLNQASFPGELKNPVSLKQITGKSYHPPEMAKELCRVLEKNFNDLRTKGFEDIYKAYQADLYKKDEMVRFRKGTRVFGATVKGVSPGGSLLVQHATEEEFAWGEVEWLIPGS